MRQNAPSCPDIPWGAGCGASERNLRLSALLAAGQKGCCFTHVYERRLWGRLQSHSRGVLLLGPRQVLQRVGTPGRPPGRRLPRGAPPATARRGGDPAGGIPGGTATVSRCGDAQVAPFDSPPSARARSGRPDPSTPLGVPEQRRREALRSRQRRASARSSPGFRRDRLEAYCSIRLSRRSSAPCI